MEFPDNIKQVTCRDCLNRKPLDFDFSMAFQPIIDVRDRSIYSYEALVRGTDGTPAGQVLAQVKDENRYYFDQACRITAIRLASQLGLSARLNINFLPNAVYRAETCIRATLEAADHFGFNHSQIVFEVTESERIKDRRHLANIFAAYKERGFTTAIDDFGEGHSGLNLLIELMPDVVKLDMNLVRDIHEDRSRQLIVRAISSMCADLGSTVIAEGIESCTELDCLREYNIHLFQGFLFARPGFESLPEPDLSCVD
ncbi:MAG: EAL domain-containing protein [Halothiobacillaceae bacterium]